MSRSTPLGPAAALAVAALACSYKPAPIQPPSRQLVAAESLYADLRDIRDRIEVSGEAGALAATHNSLRMEVSGRLDSLDSSALPAEDARALAIMRRTLRGELGPLTELKPLGRIAAERPPECDFDAATIAAGVNGLDSLRTRIYACYGWSQSHLVVRGDTMDRLTILGALGRTEDAAQRRRLFLALTPVWRSMNGDNTRSSPYRQLIAAEMAARRGQKPAAADQARAAGIPPDSLEQWLTQVLDTWRSLRPDSLVEPWDWYYETGRASRQLSRLIPRDRLEELNRAVYRSQGADVGALGVRYDLEPREGKTPVAFCTFGRRPRFINGGWRRGEPWVFATYRSGGLDNLNELLHETGHAVHLAAIRTRPAFTDWPDSDPFTEALAEFVALEIYEPAWQQHWLGDSVPLSQSLRSRYGGIVLDVAWAMFELRMQRHPEGDPNQVWTALTQHYLGIRPHPELSWWAMRGQLVESPGYMMNYAAGSVLIAAIRERTRERHGQFTTGDPSWYDWISPLLLRFGLERSSREVIESFLGKSVSPAALLADMRRISRM